MYLHPAKIRKDRVAWGMQCSTPASFIILFSEIIIPSLDLALGLAMLHLFLTHRGKIKLVMLIWLTAAVLIWGGEGMTANDTVKG